MASRSSRTALAVDASGIDDSSVDELALSKIGGQSPLASLSTNTKLRKVNLGGTPKLQSSPRKTLYLETPGARGSSPVRVKITMQAEQVDGHDEPATPSKHGRPRTKVVKVPLKDADEPLKRKPGRPRKSDVQPSALQKRKATPIRRHSKRLSGSSEIQDDFESQFPPAKKRGRPSKAALQADSGAATKSPRKVGRPKKLSQPDTDKELPFPEKKSGDESRTVPQVESEVDEIDEGYMDDVQADGQQAGNGKIISADPELLEQATESTDGVTPMSETPSVGQSPLYYMGRRKSAAFRSPTGPRRPGLSRLRKGSDSTTMRNPSQESPQSASLRQLTSKARAETESSQAPQFDFANLTPLHAKHTIAPVEPIQAHMPARSTPRPKAGGPILRRQERNEAKNSEPPPRRTLFFQQSEYSENMREPFSTKSSRFRDPTPVPSESGESQPSDQGSTTSFEAQNDERKQDEEMWRRMILDRDEEHITDAEATPASDSDGSDYGGLDEMTGRPMGEETLMQSEEFSMVSLDSLESVRGQNSSFVGGSQASKGGRSLNEPQQTAGASSNIPQQPTSVRHPSKLKQAWFPEGSPIAHLSPNVSVQRKRHSSRPQSSPYPQKSPSHGSKPSPQRQSPNDVSRRPSTRISLSSLESSPVGAAPIGSFLQSNMQQSLENESPSSEPINKNNDAHNGPPLAPHSANSRLPTPNSADKESQNPSNPRLETRHDFAGQQAQRSTASGSDHSPAKSDSVTSMQSHTPPATERGSTPIIEHASDLNHGTTFGQLPSSPPARIERSGGLEESRAWLRTQKTMEQTWEKAKQQLSPPSQPQNRPIIISDDESSSDESENEEGEKEKTTVVEDDIEDLWQEEASRGSNLDDSNLSNRSRNGTGQIKRRLFSAEEKPPSARLVKVLRTTRPFSGNPDQDHLSQSTRPQSSRLAKIPLGASVHQDGQVQGQRSDKAQPSRPAKANQISKLSNATPDQARLVESKKHYADPEHERQKKASSTIDDLFRNIAGGSTNREPPVDPGSTRPVDRMFPPSGKHGSNDVNGVQRRISTSGGLGDASLSTKPTRSSLLTRQSSPEPDASFAKQTDSFVSVASDVRQLRNEMFLSQNLPSEKRRPALQTKQVYSTTTTTQKVPVNLRSIDDSLQSDIGKYDSSSLLSLIPNKETAKPLFQAPQGPSTKPGTAKANSSIQPTQSRNATHSKAAQESERSRVAEQTTESAQAGAPGIFTRLKTHIPFLNSGSADVSMNGPPRPKHALLSNLPLLPMTLPFTKTHYIVLEELWKRYKAAPELFLTSRPGNAGLMTTSLNKWSEARLSEWGYECILKPSCLVLVALYCRLLVLKDAKEYQSVEGKELEMGESGTMWFEQRERDEAEGRTEWETDELVIGEAYVTVRLFSVMVCEIVREDEAKGVEIDRELRFKWKARGERGWKFSLLVDE